MNGNSRQVSKHPLEPSAGECGAGDAGDTCVLQGFNVQPNRG